MAISSPSTPAANSFPYSLRQPLLPPFPMAATPLTSSASIAPPTPATSLRFHDVSFCNDSGGQLLSPFTSAATAPPIPHSPLFLRQLLPQIHGGDSSPNHSSCRRILPAVP
uniref:Uncharacterized protein n=1 Tax=Arundo donax TaxID=35708 RepID=A0A0A9HB15_ARUDO